MVVSAQRTQVGWDMLVNDERGRRESRVEPGGMVEPESCRLLHRIECLTCRLSTGTCASIKDVDERLSEVS
jgi:hypothetical protein